MRLSKIKLAGFKSFVDPTTVHLLSNLVGVVGPNGSGKSNIIDAVRWVMGESSAKHLRGESMADVIFNGSSSRKPVGQASIELVFDNSDASLGGKFANYNEISVKRQVSRDGQSNYYLNGARCRRKDITDIFLGTGLGPRSYAIIEQGMITRLIEAKPDELRILIEEAAGISKYKERRRETETRMRNTHDNINRLNDLREELDKQIERLQRQARTAERYKELKQEERVLQGQLQALHWRALDAKVTEREAEVVGLETELQAEIATQRNIETSVEKQREAHTEAGDAFNEVQGRFYSVGADIASKEQAIQHARERRQQLDQDLAQVERAWQDASRHVQGDHRKLEELNEAVAEAGPRLAGAKEAEAESAMILAEAEQAMQTWQAEWETFNQQAAEPARTAEVERTRIQHLEQQSLQLEQRFARLHEEHASLNSGTLEEELETLAGELVKHQEEVLRLREELKRCVDAIGEQRELNNQLNSDLHADRSRLQTLQGRLASLEALQQAALGKRQGAVTEWLAHQGLDEAPRLAQGVQVENGWERAVETVLGFHLESVCIEQLDDVADGLASLKHGALGVFDTSLAAAMAADGGDKVSLLDKITTPWSLDSLVGSVYAANSLNEALAMRASLAAHESVVTPDGMWLGKGWLRVTRDADERAGVLHREKEIKELGAERQLLEARLEEMQLRLEEGKERLQSLEERRDHVQQAVNQADRRVSEFKAQQMGKQSRLEQIVARTGRITRELEEIQQQMTNGDTELQGARGRLQAAVEAMEQFSLRREQLNRSRDEYRQSLEQARQQARQDRDAVHQANLRLQSLQSSLDATQLNLNRMQGQLEQMSERREELRLTLENSGEPIQVLQAELEELLGARMGVEKELAEARRQVEAIDHDMRTLNDKRSGAEQGVQRVRENLERVRMASQELRVRRETLMEQLNGAGYQLEELFATLPDEATAEQWQTQVEQIAQRIQRLGAINLAAIDEYAEQSERKSYLDAQFADLSESLETLENAIRKIDRETRARFRETFDKVNEGLQRMFPRLFGGGQAFLELTGEDLLDTGVSVMARPPGKRISNIHLLSGGEKALTAVAMVFAIFELNPAPFCMLDEVDAPLDEANVGRFSNLVKDMSEHVQFIFITHNKTTMEIAQHLNGVTMHEPGVSRMVAVDVEEAAELAAM